MDMPYLSYLGLNKNSHFGGHAVVLFGYDDDQEQFWISDRDNHDYPIRTPLGEIAEDYHLVSYQEMEQARSSTHRPFPAKNKYLIIDFQGYKQVDRKILIQAIAETCDTMLNPPAKLLGINGILKFSKEILKWEKFRGIISLCERYMNISCHIVHLILPWLPSIGYPYQGQGSPQSGAVLPCG